MVQAEPLASQIAGIRGQMLAKMTEIDQRLEALAQQRN